MLIQRVTLEAWGLLEEPIEIQLHFSLSRYLDGEKPTYRVRQTRQSLFCVGKLLEKWVNFNLLHLSSFHSGFVS